MRSDGMMPGLDLALVSELPRVTTKLEDFAKLVVNVNRFIDDNKLWVNRRGAIGIGLHRLRRAVADVGGKAHLTANWNMLRERGLLRIAWGKAGGTHYRVPVLSKVGEARMMELFEPPKRSSETSFTDTHIELVKALIALCGLGVNGLEVLTIGQIASVPEDKARRFDELAKNFICEFFDLRRLLLGSVPAPHRIQ
ncbi:MAG: hypothetical protein AAB420_01865 [Patescibacteria group bacterium]